MTSGVAEIPFLQIMIRLVVAMILGGVIGYNRERDSQPAGLRTHMILVAGSCLAMILSINMAFAAKSDPARLAAQVITGIGFLGAGAIMRYGINVKGLTSASTIWSMAIVGLAVGYGYIWISVVTTLLILIALTVVNALEEKFIRTRTLRMISIDAVDKAGVIEAIQTELKDIADQSRTFDLRKSVKEGHIRIRVTALMGKKESMESFVESLSAIKGVKAVHIE
ncbi:MAG: MgtC/SapB family protein [Anaerolineaceae bacterium]|nr:MgtC/SapB family protein [Anaerolineaceae bacterium]